MTDTIEETVIIMAYPEDPQDGPVVHIFGGEVVFTETGEFLGWDAGHWWESFGPNTEAPAALDDLDTELTTNGYRRTSPWTGPVITRRGERYTANGIGRIEAIGQEGHRR